MLFQFEVTRFPYNNNSPSSSRGRRICYATPLPECEQLNFFFVVVVVALPLFWQLRARDSLQKSAGFWLEGSTFFRDFPDFLLLSFFCRFDFIFRHFYFNHGRTSRKQQRQQRHHQQQLRKRVSERAVRRTFVRKKKSLIRVFFERVRARGFLWIKIWIYKNGDERLR